jgi:hypothetical protein
MPNDDHTTILVSPAARDLAGPLIRETARGTIAADTAYQELRHYIETATADGADARQFLPSRAWFDRQIERVTATLRSTAPVIRGDE